MEVVQVLHMYKGAGETSYAKNSKSSGSANRLPISESLHIQYEFDLQVNFIFQNMKNK